MSLGNPQGFIIFELTDSGERVKLKITEEEFRQSHGKEILLSTQVVIIAKHGSRFIFIWKGSQSSVRKKFIASHIASEVQGELTGSAQFHRGKILSVDQGEEPQEFIDLFGFKTESISPELIPNPVPEVGKSIMKSHLPPISQGVNSPANSPSGNISEPSNKQQMSKSSLIKTSSPEISPKTIAPISTKPLSPTISQSKIQVESPVSLKVNDSAQIKNKQEGQKLLDRILKTDLPKDYTRKNILIGNSILYGNVIKKVQVFGEKIELSLWEPIDEIPREIFELEGHKLRIHVNKERVEIEAIEVLESIFPTTPTASTVKDESEKINDVNKWTITQMKAFCTKNGIKIPSTVKKANLVQLITEFMEQNK